MWFSETFCLPKFEHKPASRVAVERQWGWSSIVNVDPVSHIRHKLGDFFILMYALGHWYLSVLFRMLLHCETLLTSNRTVRSNWWYQLYQCAIEISFLFFFFCRLNEPTRLCLSCHRHRHVIVLPLAHRSRCISIPFCNCALCPDHTLFWPLCLCAPLYEICCALACAF